MPQLLSLLVADSNRSAILRFDTESGAFIREFVPGSGELFAPFGLTIGPQQDVFVSSMLFPFGQPPGKASGVLRYRASNGVFAGVFAADGQNGLAGAGDLKFGPDGNLYVGNRMHLFFADDPPPGSILRYNGKTGAFIDAFVPPRSGGLALLGSFVFGPDGHLYACNRQAETILRFDGATGAFIGVFVPAGSGGLGDPRGLAFGPDGNLYVSSTDRVLRYNGATGAFIDVFASSATSPLSEPTGLLFGPDDRLYVGDRGTGSIARFDAATGAYLDSMAPPKTGIASLPMNLALAEMYLSFPEHLLCCRIPRHLWVIGIGIILAVIAGLALPRERLPSFRKNR